MPSKAPSLEQKSWSWIEDFDGTEVDVEKMKLVYHILPDESCLSCKRNCKNNSMCLQGLGEGKWNVEVDPAKWSDIGNLTDECRPDDGFVGLKNLGATCYVNTFIQVWYNNPEFRQAILELKPVSGKSDGCSFALADEMSNSSFLSNQEDGGNMDSICEKDPDTSRIINLSDHGDMMDKSLSTHICQKNNMPPVNSTDDALMDSEDEGVYYPCHKRLKRSGSKDDLPTPDTETPNGTADVDLPKQFCNEDADEKCCILPDLEGSDSPEVSADVLDNTNVDSSYLKNDVAEEIIASSKSHCGDESLICKDILVPIPGNVVSHLQNIFGLLCYSKRRYIDVSQFIQFLGINAAEQQDVLEFSTLFLSVLEKALASSHHQALLQQFTGTYAYVTRCNKCGNSNSNPTNFNELDLSIQGLKTLAESLGEFTAPEELVGDNLYQCSNCCSKQEAERRIQILTLPSVLNLQLMRFVFDRTTGLKKKLSTFLQFPETLDMTEYVSSTDLSMQYSLAAVLIHRGPSAYSGHYIAYIKDPKSEEWVKFNDEETVRIGKTLQLAREDDDDGKAVKKPKTAKGWHSSRNAYMLVYRKNGLPSVAKLKPLHSLPKLVRNAVSRDHSCFDQWLSDMAKMKESSLRLGREKQEFIQEVYPKLRCSDWTCGAWLPTKWMKVWLEIKPDTEVPAIQNAPLMCSHGKLNPHQVCNAKLVDQSQAERLYTKFGIDHPLHGRDSLCQVCVLSEVRKRKFKNKISDDQRQIASLQKKKFDSSSEHAPMEKWFWVGKKSLRRWKSLATANLGDAFDTSDVHEDCELPGENLNATTSGDGDAEKAEQEFKDEETSDMDFNQDIICVEHGKLSSNESCRRLVCEELWQKLKEYFPDATEFSMETSTCSECEKDNLKSEEKRQQNKAVIVIHREELDFLLLSKNRPTWHEAEHLFIISQNFLQSWRDFMGSNGGLSPVTVVDNSCLLCLHGNLPFIPSLDEENENFALVSPTEWNVVKGMFRILGEISIHKVVEDDGQTSLIPSKDVCQQCQPVYEHSKQLFKSKPIYVRKISSDDDDVSSNRKRKSEIEIVKNNNIKGTRKSSRHHRAPGEKIIIIDAEMTLHDLKVCLYEQFHAAPYDQHIYIDEEEITGTSKTLLELGIRPEMTLKMKVDETQSEDAYLEDLTKVPSEETGFKGTGLLG